MVKVTTLDEISLGGTATEGKYYKLRKKTFVTKTLGSNFAQKQVTGDFTTESREAVSIFKWPDLINGIGLERVNSPSQNRSAWYGDLVTRYPGHIFLPPLAVAATNETGGSVQSPLLVHENNIIAVDINGVVRDATDADFGSTIDTLPNLPTDAITFSYDSSGSSVNQAMWAHDTGYTYTDDRSTFTDSTDDITYLTFWDGRVWAYDENTGALKYIFKGGDTFETVLVVNQVQKDQVLGLFTGPDATGNEILYMVTTIGLLAFDAANARMVKTPFELSYPLQTGLPSGRAVHATTWRSSIYVPWGGSIIEWDITRTGVIRSIGPSDRFNGLPDGKGGPIRFVFPSGQLLLACISSGGTSGSTVFSTILAWDDNQWSVLRTAANAVSIEDIQQIWAGAEVNNSYRAYWFEGANGFFMVLPGELDAPINIGNFAYQASGFIEYPWFEVGADVNGIALRAHIDVKGAGAAETIILSYRVDEASSFTAFTTITTDGVTTFEFPNASTPTGTSFQSMQCKVTQATGTSTKTPDVLSLSLEYEQKIASRFTYGFELDVRERYKGRTPNQMLEDIQTAITSKTKVEFSYRDSTQDPDFSKYVDVINPITSERTGLEEDGIVLLQVRDT